MADVIDISGLRMLSLLWMLLVHVCTVLYYVAGERATPVRATAGILINKSLGPFSDNKIYKNQFGGFNVMQTILDSGSLSIDTHFFLW